MRILLSFSVVALAISAVVPTAAAANSLQVTAIVGRNMKSTVECWTLEQEFVNVRGVRIHENQHAGLRTDKDNA